MPLSFFGSKVRQHLENPAYIENEAKFRELSDRTADQIRYPKRDEIDESPDNTGSAFAAENDNDDELLENKRINDTIVDKADGGEELVNLMPTTEDNGAPETQLMPDNNTLAEADSPLINVGL